jgi:transcriptional regulator with XRE-family HTH domain
MSYVTADIGSMLRAAREAKGLSQRALSKLVEVPQGHISKIESGGVDLRVSSLVELARALDLEVTLVPRQSLPAIQSIVRTSGPGAPASSTSNNAAPKELARLDSRLAELMRSLPDSVELAQLRRQVRDLQNLSMTKEDRDILNDVHATLLRARRTKNMDPVKAALDSLQRLRAEIVSGRLHTPATEKIRPAYSLAED